MNYRDTLDLVTQKMVDHLFLATVTGTSGNNVTLQHLGESVADTTTYRRLASYSSPVNGDIALCVRIAGSIVVLGKLA